jgi:hypothetical protein
LAPPRRITSPRSRVASGYGLGDYRLAVGLLAHVAFHERVANGFGHDFAFFTCMSAITTLPPLAARVRAVMSCGSWGLLWNKTDS